MALEEFLDKIGRRKIYAIILGIIYVIISYGTAEIFFPSDISKIMIFFAALLLAPSTARWIGVEESIEKKKGIENFWRNHATITEIFVFLFIGIFIGYLLVGTYEANALSYQKTFLEGQGAIGTAKNIDVVTQLYNIIANNISVIVIAFILSLFYGVGALFLTVLNASIFASFILLFAQLAQKGSALIALIFSIHFIPEVSGFLLATISGGVISKAIMVEKIGTPSFKNVIKDGTILLLFSVILIVLAALLEVFLTPWLANTIILQ